jgi:hypothetical protein
VKEEDEEANAKRNKYIPLIFEAAVLEMQMIGPKFFVVCELLDIELSRPTSMFPSRTPLTASQIFWATIAWKADPIIVIVANFPTILVVHEIIIGGV